MNPYLLQIKTKTLVYNIVEKRDLYVYSFKLVLI